MGSGGGSQWWRVCVVGGGGGVGGGVGWGGVGGFFFFNDTATTEIYTLSLHDALPIFYNAGAFNPALLVPQKNTYFPRITA